MIASFPEGLLPTLRCVDDAGALAWRPDGGAHCNRCGRHYTLDGPILQMGLDGLDAESDHERLIRDAEATQDPEPSWSGPADLMEIGATLEALDLRPSHRVLELGSGRGRFTRLLAEACREVVAVDMSAESLRVAARSVRGGGVALVQGDATRRLGAGGAFDRVLGTLASNLPDEASRQASYRAAADALAPTGRFVFSTHYFGLRARLGGEAREDRYTEGGIYRCLLTKADVRREVSPWFEQVRVRPICVVLPFSGRLGLPSVTIDRFARRIPLVRALGTLLLVVASRPRR